MTELEKQWRREENVKCILIFMLGIITLTLSLLVIAHSIDLLAVKCSL